MVPNSFPTDDFDGLLLVGHGTREPAGLAEFHDLVARVAGLRPDWRVAGGLLELAEPSIGAAVAALVRQGAKRLRAQPLLLFAAGHAKQDIPQALAEARLAAAQAGYGEVEIRQLPHLGCHPEIVRLSSQRYREAIAQAGPLDAADTGLILVGRGSRDPSATAEFLHLLGLRGRETPVAQAAPAFVAMAEPDLDVTLAAAADWPCRRIVVQPHLLFRGLLLSEIEAKVARWADRDPAHQWIVAEHLGACDALAAVLVELALPGQPAEAGDFVRTNRPHPAS